MVYSSFIVRACLDATVPFRSPYSSTNRPFPFVSKRKEGHFHIVAETVGTLPFFPNRLLKCSHLPFPQPNRPTGTVAHPSLGKSRCDIIIDHIIYKFLPPVSYQPYPTLRCKHARKKIKPKTKNRVISYDFTAFSRKVVVSFGNTIP